jgi:hypothetical protein
MYLILALLLLALQWKVIFVDEAITTDFSP